MNKILRNALFVERGLFSALRSMSAIMGLGHKIPTSSDRATVVANETLAAMQEIEDQISEILNPTSGLVLDGADTSVTVANNATESYTSTVDGYVTMNDFTGTGGQVVNLNGTQVATVSANDRITIQVKVDDVIAVVDTADGGTTFKRAVIARFQ